MLARLSPGRSPPPHRIFQPDQADGAGQPCAPKRCAPSRGRQRLMRPATRASHDAAPLPACRGDTGLAISHGRSDLPGRRVNHGPGAHLNGGDGLIAASDDAHPGRGGAVLPDVDPLGGHPRAAQAQPQHRAVRASGPPVHPHGTGRPGRRRHARVPVRRSRARTRPTGPRPAPSAAFPGPGTRSTRTPCQNATCPAIASAAGLGCR